MTPVADDAVPTARPGTQLRTVTPKATALTTDGPVGPTSMCPARLAT